MIAELRPYPAYKDSGVPWLGDVPEHWGLVPLRRVTIARCDGPFGAGLKSAHYSDSGIRVIRLQNIGHGEFKDNDAAFITPQHYATLGDHSVREGDLLVAGLGDDRHPAGRACVAPAHLGPAMVKADCFRFRLDRSQLDPRFGALHLTATSTAISSILSTGATRQRINLQAMSSRVVAMPSLAEQSTIVRFLAWAERRIRRVIRARQKRVKLLEEYKHALIHRAVTGQINVRTGQTYPSYKRSGVEWLGEVPEHWELVPLRRVTSARCDGPFGAGLKSMHYTDSGIRVIRLQNIGHGQFNAEAAAFIAPEHYATLGDHSVREGDLLVAGLGDKRHPAGRACIAPAGLGPAMVKADCFRFRVDTTRLNPHFGALHLTATSTAVSSILSTGATRQRINLEMMSARVVALPSLAEQDAIVEYLQAQTLKIDSTIATGRRQIDLLKELRTRLISDVVTGKLDVREVAASLPDEPAADESEPLDEEEVAEAEEGAREEDLEAAEEDAA